MKGVRGNKFQMKFKDTEVVYVFLEGVFHVSLDRDFRDSGREYTS